MFYLQVVRVWRPAIIKAGVLCCEHVKHIGRKMFAPFLGARDARTQVLHCMKTLSQLQSAYAKIASIGCIRFDLHTLWTTTGAATTQPGCAHVVQSHACRRLAGGIQSHISHPSQIMHVNGQDHTAPMQLHWRNRLFRASRQQKKQSLCSVAEPKHRAQQEQGNS